MFFPGTFAQFLKYLYLITCLVGLIYPPKFLEAVVLNRCFKNFRKFHRKIPVLESFFNKFSGRQALKRYSNTGALLKNLQNFKLFKGYLQRPLLSFFQYLSMSSNFMKVSELAYFRRNLGSSKMLNAYG